MDTADTKPELWLGRVRARQDRLGNRDRCCVLGLLIHGDAAFAGEGIVHETPNFRSPPGYTVVHALHHAQGRRNRNARVRLFSNCFEPIPPVASPLLKSSLAGHGRPCGVPASELTNVMSLESDKVE